MSDNLRVWNKVQQTDPAHTKPFKKSGGFGGTAINATYQIKRATELWGPIGGLWGYEVVTSEYVKGADNDIIHVLMIKFRHPDGAFDVFGQTTFVGSNKNGSFTDEEAPKKSLTDAITKGLAMLGFSADVFLGMYDDNKYVNDLRARLAAPTEMSKKEFVDHCTAMSDATELGTDALKEAFKTAYKAAKGYGDEQAMTSLTAKYEEAKAMLKVAA